MCILEEDYYIHVPTSLMDQTYVRMHTISFFRGDEVCIGPSLKTIPIPASFICKLYIVKNSTYSFSFIYGTFHKKLDDVRRSDRRSKTGRTTYVHRTYTDGQLSRGA